MAIIRQSIPECGCGNRRLVEVPNGSTTFLECQNCGIQFFIVEKGLFGIKKYRPLFNTEVSTDDEDLNSQTDFDGKPNRRKKHKKEKAPEPEIWTTWQVFRWALLFGTATYIWICSKIYPTAKDLVGFFIAGVFLYVIWCAILAGASYWIQSMHNPSED